MNYEAIDNSRTALALSQKKGLPFIIASVILWGLITYVSRLNLPLQERNLITFFCSCPLMPLATLIGKIIGVNIFDKTNPLSKLGFLFTINQTIYLIIVMWAFNSAPGQMVMLYAIVFGAHLLPYSWLYKSAGYKMAAVLIPIASLFLGLRFGSFVVALFTCMAELLLTIVLFAETSVLQRHKALT